MSGTPILAHQADEVFLGFTRALRAAGVPVTSDRSQSFLQAVAIVGAHDRRATYWAGRATLCGGPDDLERYDQVFEAWFDPRGQLPGTRPARSPGPAVSVLPLEDSAGTGTEQDESADVVRAAASATEVLRQRDLAQLSLAEKRRLESMYATLHPRAPLRRTARTQAWRRGQVDPQRTLRASLRSMGEPARIRWRRPGRHPRRVVLLIDVSGSMGGYADALLRLAHRYLVASTGPVEVFTLGTRLTHITRALRLRDPARAIIAAGETVPDWSGGTRLGETMKAFVDRWGARGLARGAVVVVFSDGWERGETAVLGAQMERLSRIAHRVVWVNPHRGKPGYEPVQQGVLAVLPHVDDFLAGHSLATFAELVEVVAHA